MEIYFWLLWDTSIEAKNDYIQSKIVHVKFEYEFYQSKHCLVNFGQSIVDLNVPPTQVV